MPRLSAAADNSKYLKEKVADMVFAALDGAMLGIERVPGVVEATHSDVSNLQRQIKVKTQSSGTHYYTVQVKETW